MSTKQKAFFEIREAPHFKKVIESSTALSFSLESRNGFITDQLRETGVIEELISIAERKGAITASFVIKIPGTGEELEQTPEIVITDDTDDGSQEFLSEKICSMILAILFKYSKRMSAKKYAPKYRHKYQMVKKALVEVIVKA